MTTSAETDECVICHLPEQAHKDRKMVHRFQPVGGSSALIPTEPENEIARDDRRIDHASSARQAPQGSVRMPSISDPVLRMALIRRGVITVADLDEVEAELRATGAVGYEPPSSMG